MRNYIKLGQGLAWAAWLIFIASLFMPMETNSLAGPCSWPCTEPFIDYGWKNATFFVLSIITFPMEWTGVVYSAVFDPLTLRKIIETALIMGIYTVIGLGQLLIVLAPVWPLKIKKTIWRRLHLWAVLLSMISALAYGLFQNLRLGLDILRGYYFWALSFVLLFVASFFLQDRKSGETSTEERRLDYQQS